MGKYTKLHRFHILYISHSCLSFNPLRTRKLITGTSANNEDPDEMLHYAAFHRSLHCLLRQNRSSEEEIQYYF